MLARADFDLEVRFLPFLGGKAEAKTYHTFTEFSSGFAEPGIENGPSLAESRVDWLRGGLDKVEFL